jgi:hypothetical protein
MNDIVKKILIKPLTNIIYLYYNRPPFIATTDYSIIRRLQNSNSEIIKFILYKCTKNESFLIALLDGTLGHFSKFVYDKHWLIESHDYYSICFIKIADLKKHIQTIDCTKKDPFLDLFKIEFSDNFIRFLFDENVSYKFNINWKKCKHKYSIKCDCF